MISVKRWVKIRFVAAVPEEILSRIVQENVEVIKAVWIDPLTVEVCVAFDQYKKVKATLDRCGMKYSIVKNKGLLWRFGALKRRPVLLIGTALFLALALILPQRILTVYVAGNETVPTRKILYYAETCGVAFGAKASDVRSEHVKNDLLDQLPELQWIGVTTSGCTATIQVKERSISAPEKYENTGVSSIIADADGTVTEISVLRGTPLVKTGQTVRKGDMLISGYTDCGLVQMAQEAKGEVFAHTLRKINAISPLKSLVRGEKKGEHTCIRIIIGKKLINLCNHSGIPDATCVKMYSEDYWTLPGGFSLPICVQKIRTVSYDVYTALQSERTSGWLKLYLREYLLSQMIAGSILRESVQMSCHNDGCELFGEYACHEMIGRVKNEEITEQYAEDH